MQYSWETSAKGARPSIPALPLKPDTLISSELLTGQVLPPWHYKPCFPLCGGQLELSVFDPDSRTLLALGTSSGSLRDRRLSFFGAELCSCAAVHAVSGIQHNRSFKLSFRHAVTTAVMLTSADEPGQVAHTRTSRIIGVCLQCLHILLRNG